MAEVDGLNAGYARALLEEYLENPEGVPSEWRAFTVNGNSSVVCGNVQTENATVYIVDTVLMPQR